VTDLYLRAATPEDSGFAYQTKRVAFHTYAEQVLGWDDAHQRSLHQTRFASQDFRIIQMSGSEVGVLAIQLEPDRLKVYQIFIHPDHQGKGVGTACMRIVIDEVKAANLPIELQVLRVNPKAIDFYKRIGFVEVGRTDTQLRKELT